MHASWKGKAHSVVSAHCQLWKAFLIASSYLHCKWATLEELEKDPRISQKIKRFRNKQAQMKHIFTEVRLPKHAAIYLWFI